MKKLTIAVLALLASPAFADDVSDALKAATEAQFLAKAGPGWTALGQSRYETIDAQGQRISVGFGDDAMVHDLASFEERAIALKKKLQASKSPSEQARLRNSIATLGESIRSIEQGMERLSKSTTNVSDELYGCDNVVAIEAQFEMNLGMTLSGGVTVEAWGPSFVPDGAFPAVGTVSLTARANDNYDYDSREIRPSYMGDFLSSQAIFSGDYECILEAQASIFPACPTAGYRSILWSTTCQQLGNNQPPAAQYGPWRRR